MRQSQSLAISATVAGRSTPSERLSKEALLRHSRREESTASARSKSGRSAQSGQSGHVGGVPPASPCWRSRRRSRCPDRTAAADRPPAPERRPASRLGYLGGLAAGLLVLERRRDGGAPAAFCQRSTGGGRSRAGGDCGAAFVHWTVLSVPPGAEVVRTDGQLLGTTPLELERPAGSGETILTPGDSPGSATSPWSQATAPM